MTFIYIVASILYLHELRDGLKKSRYYTQRVLTIWKIVVFAACILVSLDIQGDNAFSFFSTVAQAFNERNYTVYEVSDHNYASCKV